MNRLTRNPFPFLCIAAVMFCTNVYAKSRLIYLDQELKSASYVGEVVVTFYNFMSDSGYGKNVVRSMTCYPLDKADSSMNFYPMLNSAYSVSYCLKPELQNKKTEEGYWPAPGDTVLIVNDSANKISLFAKITNKGYEFWSPYFTDSWATVFYFNSPAEPVSTDARGKKSQKALQSGATSHGYTYACYFHCMLPRKSLTVYR